MGRPRKSWSKPSFLSTLPARGATRSHAGAGGGLKIFLSTLPARGATVDTVTRAKARCISIHAPREGSDDGQRSSFGIRPISIHAPREGSDVCRCVYFFFCIIFLSTLPARGATGTGTCGLAGSEYFYPRSPRGERQVYRISKPAAKQFLSTLPARGATYNGVKQLPQTMLFLSTLPARGATSCPRCSSPSAPTFLSTLPARGATDNRLNHICTIFISIHAPREGSDIQALT